jgi:hypothetical protein
MPPVMTISVRPCEESKAVFPDLHKRELVGKEIKMLFNRKMRKSVVKTP